MKILFISEYLPQEMLGVMFVSRALKEAGHETKASFLPDRHWTAKVKEIMPNAFAVFGGPHATFSPEFVETPGIDAICRGEGEQAIVELVNRLRDKQDFYDVQNFWFKHKETGEIIKNPQRPLVQD